MSEDRDVQSIDFCDGYEDCNECKENTGKICVMLEDKIAKLQAESADWRAAAHGWREFYDEIYSIEERPLGSYALPMKCWGN